MKITREQAIKILDKATDKGAFDDWWIEVCDSVVGEGNDAWPTLYDVFDALGVSKEECNKLGV